MWSGTGGHKWNLFVSLLHFLVTLEHLLFFTSPPRPASLHIPAITAALILLLLLVLALGMREQLVTKEMEWRSAEGFDVWRMTGPQACLPPDNP
jgi:hypothetical protein